MHLSITVTIQPDTLQLPTSTMKTPVEAENCQVLHGLQHRTSTSGSVVRREKGEDPAIAAESGHVEEDMVYLLPLGLW